MSAIFSIVEGIVQVIVAILEALGQVVSGIAAALSAIPQIIEGIGQVIPTQVMIYTFWFVIEAALIAFFPAYALWITVGFLLFTIFGLWQGVQEILGAPTVVLAVIALAALGVNLYLFFAVG